VRQAADESQALWRITPQCKCRALFLSSWLLFALTLFRVPGLFALILPRVPDFFTIS
jgi:hypothetical protein